MQLEMKLTYNKTIAQVSGKASASGTQRQQVLIFVHSRNETFKTAKYLIDLALEEDTLDLFVPSEAAKQILKETTLDSLNPVGSADLREVLENGIGIHHAGMTKTDRSLVEDLFREGHLSVLCSTATLAWGVNLPAHCVIIKGSPSPMIYL